MIQRFCWDPDIYPGQTKTICLDFLLKHYGSKRFQWQKRSCSKKKVIMYPRDCSSNENLNNNLPGTHVTLPKA